MTDEICTVTMYPKLERREWIFGTAPDPRDARIAELEAALREVRLLYSDPRYLSRSNIEVMLDDMMRTIDKALMPPPESDMTITHEAMDA